ncbi:MAG: DUF3160 domain-containing protein [Deltaproteobacteria bacterium]|nr:DUF3160 domain-containing protein [Deltaproteobacteria bacterium]MBN2672733.1 DUF3160 domain-containing protein [Deltaproteobacteria bacterium]
MNSFKTRWVAVWLGAALLVGFGCDSKPNNSQHGTDSETASDFDTHDSEVDTNDLALLPEEKQAEFDALMALYADAQQMTAADFDAAYPAVTNTQLNYDPLAASNMDLLQASDLALSEAAEAQLAQNGFVIDRSHSFWSFFEGYAEIYRNDLPVYISADAILDSVHRSYDSILMTLEEYALIEELDALLTGMRAALATTEMDAVVKADVDVYLTVAHSLLLNEVQSNTADADVVSSFFDKAVAADGMESVSFFGGDRLLDFSQFTPRGHYEDTEALQAYFRAMMWLGLIDLRMVETNDSGEQFVNRSQVLATLYMGALMAPYMVHWERLNQTIDLFVGPSDNMMPTQIAALQTALGIDSPAALDTLSDDEIKAIVLGGDFGTQQIMSHLMVNGMTSGTLPLNASFLILGQRFIVDSFVFSNLVYDRVNNGETRRMMPNPLDVGFAALQNNQAGPLLADELQRYRYHGDLHLMRSMLAQNSADHWKDNLYNYWIKSLQTLSDNSQLPSVGQTAQWQTRMLNTQLGSWSQLKHDTLLYAKQSYTDMPSCEFPEAYVDPYPAFFESLTAYADLGLQAAQVLADADTVSASLLQAVADYFTELGFAADILGEMARQQLDGIPFTAGQLQFINEAIAINDVSVGCYTEEVPAGWYERLFFDSSQALERDPVIADVHTQPADEGGIIVGRVLHVATSDPRLMVVTVNQCNGPRAYAGMAFSYHEKITEDFVRMTDSEWAEEINTTPPADVPWMGNLLSD